MNTVAIPSETRSHVYAADLLDAFHAFQPKIKTLSLDCFDTLLWRKTATPIDVFYALQHRPTFQALGFSAELRIRAESKARQMKMIQTSSTEVTLADIYRAAFPNLNEQQIIALAEEELAEEVEACYAFLPVIDLMRAAKKNNLKIIIVSDTYLKEKQLRHLLTQHLPADVMSSITKIFCSCENRKSKSDGLLKIAIDNMHQSAHSVLHVGDSIVADFHGAKAVGAHAMHLLQHDTTLTELLRMQAIASNFLSPAVRDIKPLYSPFRGVLATTAQNAFENPAATLGYAASGPLLYSFCKFILDDIEKMQAAGKNPKILFLMRDGYLPSLICEAITGNEIGYRVNISRFVALASSFRTKNDIDRYLSEIAGTLRFDDICRQFLLPKETTDALVNKAKNAGNYSGMEFIRLIQQDKILKLIINKSTEYRDRLKRHLEKKANLTPGDTLVFVDLGYTGTAQVLLEPIFRDEMQVEIHGRYLISLNSPDWKKSRRGLLDPSWCDNRTMLTLVNYIALLEQICTSNENSVVDFDNDGNPLFTDVAVNKKQHHKLNEIQAECIHFAKDAERFFQTTHATLTTDMLRESALAQLGRLLFLPTNQEIQYLQSFEFELNLGTDDLLRVIDQEAGLEGLRKRGLMFMERNTQSMRTNYPAELRTAGLELSMLLLAQHRFGLEIRMQDLSLLRENLNIIVINDRESLQKNFEAIPTHDGYYSLLIPVGDGKFQVGIQFGKNYEWVQLESAEIIPSKALFSQLESLYTKDISANLIVDDMTDQGGGLFFCSSPNSLLIYIPQLPEANNNDVLRVVFRPVVKRKTK
jgi:predicted HAD superfamily hydrolase